MYKLQPACFKWAAMAAIASHHVRLALFPLRLDADRTGYVDIPHSLRRPKLLLTQDVNTIRATNNAIFNDLFWVHFAHVSAEDGIGRLRALLQAERHYAPVLAGFEAIDQGRRVLEDAMASAEARQRADDLIWEGNVGLLEHEQCALVQPNFDRLSFSSAWLVAIGSATSFEMRGVRQEIADFTSFYLYSFTRGIPHALRANPARSAGTKVAEDHPLRGPLALARNKRRSALPQIRRRHGHGRRQPATHLRRSARLRVEPLRPAAFTRRRATASCETAAMAPVTGPTMNRSPRNPAATRGPT